MLSENDSHVPAIIHLAEFLQGTGGWEARGVSWTWACGEGESRFWKKSSSDGNYQTLRNAAAALTRQAAAWLQELRRSPACVTPSQVVVCAASENLAEVFVCFCPPRYQHARFPQLYPLSAADKRDHIMSAGDCLSVRALCCMFMTGQQTTLNFWPPWVSNLLSLPRRPF